MPYCCTRISMKHMELQEPVIMVVLTTAHHVCYILWVQVAISNKEIGFLWRLKFVALWRIVTTKSMHDVANMLKNKLSESTDQLSWASKHTAPAPTSHYPYMRYSGEMSYRYDTPLSSFPCFTQQFWMIYHIWTNLSNNMCSKGGTFKKLVQKEGTSKHRCLRNAAINAHRTTRTDTFICTTSVNEGVQYWQSSTLVCW